jgi:hypothetical protein
MKLSVKSPGMEELVARVDGIPAEFRHRTDFKKFGKLISVRAVRRNFTAQKDSQGKAWAARKTKGTGMIFHGQSGRMAKGIAAGDTTTGFFVAAGDATKAFNAAHNFGERLWWRTKGKKGNAPRQFMYLSVAALKEIGEELRAWVKRRLTKRG